VLRNGAESQHAGCKGAKRQGAEFKHAECKGADPTYYHFFKYTLLPCDVPACWLGGI
jgi:hypothetical protein